MHRIRKLPQVVTLLTLAILFGSFLQIQVPVEFNMSMMEPPSSKAVVAADTHNQYTMEMGWAVLAPTIDFVELNLGASAGVYGNFLVTDPASGLDQIVDFRIMDQSNFDLWTDGQTATSYHRRIDVSSYSFKFKTPHSSSWHFVFANKALFLSKTVDFHLYRDTTPPEIDMNLYDGKDCSGTEAISATITEATFNIEEVKLYIDNSLKLTRSNSFSYSWDTTDYSNGEHQIRIEASDDVGNTASESVTVDVSNSIFGGVVGDNPALVTDLLVIGFIGVIVIVAVGAVLFRRRGAQ